MTTDLGISDHALPRPLPTAPSPRTGIVTPTPLARRLGRRWAGRPFRALALVGVAGYVVLTIVLLVLGFAATETPSIDRWDESVVSRIARARGETLNGLAQIGSYFGETLVVIAIAIAATAVMAWRRLWEGIGLLALGLLIEVTVFLTVSLTVDRTRPGVDPLDPAPPTGSYPSGHTAAAVVLYGTLALIVAARTNARAVKVLAWMLAVALAATVGVARIVLGMHHPTDEVGSLVGALGCMLVALLGTRAAVAAARDRRPAAAAPEEAVGG